MNYALLLLAGSSSRFNNKTPKQFYLIKNKPIYYYPLKTLNDSKDIDGIIVLTLSEKVYEVYNFIKDNNLKKVNAVISGGKTRTETVRFGLNKLKEFVKDDDIILIHDAARPLIDNQTISTAINETKRKEATTFAMKSYDTLIKSYPNYQVKEYLNRDEIFRVQTPQTFKYALLLEAYNKNANHLVNDDTELIHLLKHPVHLLRGNERLFKITQFEDIKKLESYIK